MSFLNALTLIFVVLKLVGVIQWPWVAVVLPTIIFVVFVIVVVIVKAVAEWLYD